MPIRIEDFGGLIPRTNPARLPGNAAQIARNVNLTGGVLTQMDVDGPFTKAWEDDGDGNPRQIRFTSADLKRYARLNKITNLTPTAYLTTLDWVRVSRGALAVLVSGSTNATVNSVAPPTVIEGALITPSVSSFDGFYGKLLIPGGTLQFTTRLVGVSTAEISLTGPYYRLTLNTATTQAGPKTQFVASPGPSWQHVVDLFFNDDLVARATFSFTPLHVWTRSFTYVNGNSSPFTVNETLPFTADTINVAVQYARRSSANRFAVRHAYVRNAGTDEQFIQPLSPISDFVRVEPHQYLRATVPYKSGQTSTLGFFYRGENEVVDRLFELKAVPTSGAGSGGNLTNQIILPPLPGGTPAPPNGNYPPDFTTDGTSGEAAFRVGLLSHPAGFYVGKYNAGGLGEVWFSDYGRAWIWPADWKLGFAEEIVAMGLVGRTVIIWTTSQVWAFSGSDPSTLAQSGYLLTDELPLLANSVGSIARIGGGLAYATNDGLAVASSGSVQVVTKDFYTREDWLALAPAEMKCWVADNSLFAEFKSGKKLRFDFDEGLKRISEYDGVVDIATESTFNDGVWRSKKFTFDQPTMIEHVEVDADGPALVKLLADGGSSPFATLQATPNDPIVAVPEEFRSHVGELEVEVALQRLEAPRLARLDKDGASQLEHLISNILPSMGAGKDIRALAVLPLNARNALIVSNTFEEGGKWCFRLFVITLYADEPGQYGDGSLSGNPFLVQLPDGNASAPDLRSFCVRPGPTEGQSWVLAFVYKSSNTSRVLSIGAVSISISGTSDPVFAPATGTPVVKQFYSQPSSHDTVPATIAFAFTNPSAADKGPLVFVNSVSPHSGTTDRVNRIGLNADGTFAGGDPGVYGAAGKVAGRVVAATSPDGSRFVDVGGDEAASSPAAEIRVVRTSSTFLARRAILATKYDVARCVCFAQANDKVYIGTKKGYVIEVSASSASDPSVLREIQLSTTQEVVAITSSGSEVFAVVAPKTIHRIDTTQGALVSIETASADANCTKVTSKTAAMGGQDGRFLLFAGESRNATPCAVVLATRQSAVTIQATWVAPVIGTTTTTMAATVVGKITAIWRPTQIVLAVPPFTAVDSTVYPEPLTDPIHVRSVTVYERQVIAAGQSPQVRLSAGQVTLWEEFTLRWDSPVRLAVLDIDDEGSWQPANDGGGSWDGISVEVYPEAGLPVTLSANRASKGLIEVPLGLGASQSWRFRLTRKLAERVNSFSVWTLRQQPVQGDAIRALGAGGGRVPEWMFTSYQFDRERAVASMRCLLKDESSGASFALHADDSATPFATMSAIEAGNMFSPGDTERQVVGSPWMKSLRLRMLPTSPTALADAVEFARLANVADLQVYLRETLPIVEFGAGVIARNALRVGGWKNKVIQFEDSGRFAVVRVVASSYGTNGIRVRLVPLTASGTAAISGQIMEAIATDYRDILLPYSGFTARHWSLTVDRERDPDEVHLLPWREVWLKDGRFVVRRPETPFSWRAFRLLADKPFSPSYCRVISSYYPVAVRMVRFPSDTLSIGESLSPVRVGEGSAADIDVVAMTAEPFRLPRVNAAKLWRLEVDSHVGDDFAGDDNRIAEVRIANSSRGA